MLQDGAVLNQKTAPVEREIGGVKYIITPELANSLDAEFKKKQEAIDAAAKQPVRTEIKEVIKEVKQPGTVQYGDRLFSDPDAVLNEYGDKIVERVSNMYTQKEAEKKAAEAAQQSLNNFYSSFFNENKELSQDRDLVEFIFERNYANWNTEANGDLNILKKRLAEKSTSTILRNVRPNENPKTTVILESGNTEVTGQKVVEKPENSGSMTSIIKARNAARQKK